MESYKESLILSVCPISRYGNYFVTASGTGNKEAESYLKVYKFDLKYPEDPMKLLSQVKVSVAFTAIGWTRYGEETEDHRFGFIVGGHQDGSVTLWEATAIIQAKDVKKTNFGLLQSKKFHSSSVNVIKFNQKVSVFATASRDIIIISIEKNLTMESPMMCPSQDNREITSLNWNEKVSHILAAATTSGTTYIWEMKKTELYLTITDQGILGEGNDEEYRKEIVNTKTLWCNDGVQIIMAYDHPEYNFLTQYHMKQPNSPSAEYYGGHREPVIDLCKNPNDTNFFLSLGKDDTVTCWSLRTQKPLVYIQLQEKSSGITWLNKTPDIFLSISYDGNVSYHQVNFSNESMNKGEIQDAPPRWLAKKSGVAFGFGGKFVSFNEKNSSNLTVHSLIGNEELHQKIKSFIEKVEKSNLAEVFEEKVNSSLSTTSRDKNAVLFWVALKCVYTNDFNELFRYMGFDKTKLQSEVYTYIGKKVDKVQKKERQKITNINLMANNEEAEKFWNEAITKNEKEPEVGIKQHDVNAMVSNEKPMTIQETVTRNINWSQGAEKLIKQSLLIGDLESAVDVALKSGRDAEALLIASAGDKELFNKAKQSFFNKNKDLFIKNIFSSIINGNFDSLFDYNVLKEWKEYILYAKTYQQASEFLQFANNLGDKLVINPDIYMSLVCYILGKDYEKCVDLLYSNFLKDTEKVGKNEKKFYLQNLFEQVISIKNVLQYNQAHDKTDKIISEYCDLLINEGLFIEACTYLIKIRNHDSRILTIYDRLYNHCEPKLGSKFPKLQPPFNIVTVKPKIEKKTEKFKVNMNSGKDKDLYDSANNNINAATKNIFNNDMNKPPVINKPIGTSVSGNLPKPQPFVRNPNTQTVNETANIKETVNFNSNPISNLKNPPIKSVMNPVMPSTNPNPSPIVNNQVRISKQTVKPVNPLVPSFNKKPQNENLNEDAQSVNSNVSNTPFNPQPLSRTVNPPRPMFPIAKATPSATFPVKSDSISTHPNPQTAMTAEEEFVYTSFEKFVTVYNSVYTDENKQKDFFNRVSALLTKLKNHEIKLNLLKLIQDFINLYESDASTADLKKLQLKIQANGWDQNKTWMSCIEKIVNIPRK